MKKRLLTMLEVLLSVCMVLIPMAVTASAENGPARTDTALMSEETVSVGRIDVAGQDDMGRLFTNAIEQQESGNSGPEDEELYRIRNVAVEDSSVTAEYTAAADCYLRIEILHETEETLLASETVQAAADQQQLTLTIGLLDPENENHPDYFILRAYLEEQEPEQEPVVRDSFETFAYTGKWQDFYSKTADDFDADRVVNLDEDKNSNFAVYNDDVVVCKRQGNGNMLLVNDPAQQRYVIANPDTELLALTAGDILVLQYNDSDSIITRVQSSAVGNGTVTVIGNNDLTPDDVFSYAKIEMAADPEDVEIDDSALPDGVVYEGIVTHKNTSSSACAAGAAVLAGNEPTTVEYEKSFRFKIGKSTESGDEESSDTGYISVEGSVNLTADVTHKFSVTYYRDNYFKELKVGYEYNLTVQGEASAAAELNVPLAAWTYKLGKLGKIDLSPYLNFSIEGKAVFEGIRVTANVGVTLQNQQVRMEGSGNLSFGTTKLEVNVFAGLRINPTLKLMNACTISLDGKLGTEITAEKCLFSPTTNDEERHTCRNCISGTASVVGQVTGTVKYPKKTWEKAKSIRCPLYDWYYSLDHKELGLGECPYREYRCTICVKDEKGFFVSGAVINETFLTNEYGEAVLYLSREPIKLTAVKYPMKGSMIADTDKPQVFEIIISSGDPDDDDDDDPGEIVDYDQLCSEGYVLVCDEATKTCMIDLYYGGKADLVIPSGVIYHNTVCRVVTLDSRSFSKYGTNLVKVTIPGSVRYIGECAFSGCVNLKNVTVKKGVMDIADGAFMDCTNLESVSLPDTVEHVGYTAFARCYNLRSIDLGGASTIAYGAFMNCSKLGKLTLSAGRLRHIGDYAFYNCERLQTVVFSDRTSPASTEDDANIPYYCITRNKAIPDGDYLGTGAFGAGSSTEPFPAYVEITADAGQLNDFSFDLLLRCALESIEADEDNKAYYTVDGVLYDREKKELLCCPDQHIGNVTVPDEVSSVGRKAFAGCIKKKYVTLSANVTSVEYDAFDGVKNLTFIAPKGSYAVSYAKTHGIPYILTLKNISSVSPTAVMAGGEVTVKCSANYGLEPYKFAVRCRRTGTEDWTVLQNFSTNDTLTVRPDTKPGWEIKVTAKDAAGQVKEKISAVPVWLPLENRSVLSADTVLYGGSVTVDLKPAEGKEPYVYAVWYRKAGASKWSSVQKYSKNAAVSLTPQAATAYEIRTAVRDAKGNTAEKILHLTVKRPLVNNSRLSAASMKPGESIIVRCKASDGKAPYMFRVCRKADGASDWKVLQDFSENSNVVFTAEKTGKYTVRVSVRDADGDTADKDLTLTVKSNLTNLSKLSSYFIMKGDSVSVKCAAAGGTEPYRYSVLYKKKSGTNWSVSASNSEKTRFTLMPMAACDYDVRIIVRDNDGSTAVKQFTLTVIKEDD